jgi:adenosylcobinamide-GDP ribazoletransferase
MIKLRRAVAARLAEGQLALMTLTRFPVGKLSEPCPSPASACWAFPLAGLAVGLTSALVLFGLLWLGVPSSVAAGLTLAVGILVTGGLHEDGLADVADGFGGGRTRERKLEIMRDSHIGTFGTLALVLMIGLRWSAVTTVVDRNPSEALLALVAIAIASRSVLPLALGLVPPARTDGLGYGSAHPSRTRIFASLILGGLALMLLLSAETALAMSAVICLIVLMGAWWAYRQIGGQTGDVVGAIQQGTDLGAWIVLLVIAET